MNLGNDFKNYIANPDELIGKKVLVCGRSGKRSLSTIVQLSASKKSFKVGRTDSLKNYRVNDGCLKTSKQFEFGRCQLVSDEEAEQFSKEKEIENKLTHSRYLVRVAFDKLKVTNLTIDECETILSIVTPIIDKN